MDETIWIIYLLNEKNTIYKVVKDPSLDLHTLLDLGSNMHVILDLGSIGVVEKPLSLSSPKIILTLHLRYSTWILTSSWMKVGGQGVSTSLALLLFHTLPFIKP
jgi:hypothetical protein